MWIPLHVSKVKWRNIAGSTKVTLEKSGSSAGKGVAVQNLILPRGHRTPMKRCTQPKNWTCEANIEDGKTCGQECVSHVHLAQHIRGLHGPGWDSKCGKNFKWPSSKYTHEGECTVCKKIKKKNVRKLH